MRGTRDRSAELALGMALAAMLAVWSFGLTPGGALKRLIGVMDVNGTSVMGYVDKPVRIMTISGNRPGEQDFEDRRSAYHVLFLHPAAEIEEIDVHDVAGTPRYSPLLHAVTIGDRRYWLWKGNLFVVRLGAGGEPRVTQLRATVRHTMDGPMGMENLERAFLRAARGDAEVQRALLDLHSYPATPRRKCARRAFNPARSL